MEANLDAFVEVEAQNDEYELNSSLWGIRWMDYF